MAHIFKHPNRQSKGIIVFTHKEFNYFCKGVKISKSDLFSFWKLIIKIYKLKDPLILKKYIKKYKYL